MNIFSKIYKMTLIYGKTKFRSKRKNTLKLKVVKSKRPAYKRKTIGFNGPFKAMFSKSPFATSYPAKLNYSEGFTLTTGTAGVMGTEQIYGLNNLYDPNYSGVGHQPYGYDQMSPLYRVYMVFGINMEITITDPSNDGLVVGAVVQPSNGTATVATYTPDVIKERPGSVTRVINNSGSQKQVIRQYIPLHRLEGISKSMWNARSTYASTVGAGPSSEQFLRIAVGSDAGNVGHTVKVRVYFTYYCKFYDRITQGQS